MPRALSPLQSDQRSYTSELSWYPEFGESAKKKLVSTEEEGNLEFAGYQGCSGYNGCGVAVIYSVVSGKTEGVRRTQL
jgi:hypothetical protein